MSGEPQAVSKGPEAISIELETSKARRSYTRERKR